MLDACTLEEHAKEEDPSENTFPLTLETSISRRRMSLRFGKCFLFSSSRSLFLPFRLFSNIFFSTPNSDPFSLKVASVDRSIDVHIHANKCPVKSQRPLNGGKVELLLGILGPKIGPDSGSSVRLFYP